MENGIRCFLVEPSEYVRRRLRVDTLRRCPQPVYESQYCGATYYLDVIIAPDAPDAPDADGGDRSPPPGAPDDALKADAAIPWPTQCSRCQAALDDGATTVYRYVDRERKWRNVETGDEYDRLHEAMPGAMWRAPWLAQHTSSQDDGAPLCVMTPGGVWGIDDQASNCTMPDDHQQQQHHCWVRHGVPPLVTADKQGTTCAAGAGSIAACNYHGYLRDGYLTTS